MTNQIQNKTATSSAPICQHNLYLRILFCIPLGEFFYFHDDNLFPINLNLNDNERTYNGSSKD